MYLRFRLLRDLTTETQPAPNDDSYRSDDERLVPAQSKLEPVTSALQPLSSAGGRVARSPEPTGDSNR
jgi:hypothetical protein